MLDARFSHLYFCQSLYTLQRGLSTIANLLVKYEQVAKFGHFGWVLFEDLYVNGKNENLLMVGEH